MKEVERYRNYWKPAEVTTLLLAESHVHTSPDDFSRFWKYEGLRGHFVRFVYCLGYGEDNLFRDPPKKNAGTRPFWEILYCCLHPARGNRDFGDLLKSGTRGWDQRVRNKVMLLESLKEKGVWLLDASPVAINTFDSKTKIALIKEAWKIRTGSLVRRLADEGLQRVGIVGRTVNRAIGLDLAQLGFQPEIFDQPGYHMTAEHRWEQFARYYELCR